MAKNITVIPATLDRHTGIPSHIHYKRRVAGYARVSTDSEEQLTSYEAQVDYYTQYIKANPEWQFVAVYTDEGISATNTKHRDGFNRMVQDALDGKIDLIVTKSVSRFARNTVDSLTTVRKLKEKGVEVYFQKENIYTLDSKGELLITIMSSLAQEESRSISENVTWGQRKRFADGKVSMPYRHFLGYRKGADGLPEIVPEEAELVRRIYKLFMQGKTAHAIGKILTSEGIPTPAGKAKWQSSTIESILQNEKYRGDARLQKKFTVDFLQKKIQLVQAALCDCTELDTQQATLAEEMEIVGELIRQCIEENTIKVQNQEEYMERYERHTRRYEKMKKRYEAIEAERQRRKEQNDRISAFAAILAGQSEMPIEFNDDLWLAAVDHATVNADETVTFTFKSGIEITEQM